MHPPLWVVGIVIVNTSLLLYMNWKTWHILSAQKGFSPGTFSMGHNMLTMQIIPGGRCRVNLGSCANNKGKSSHNTDRLDKLETTVPERERFLFP